MRARVPDESGYVVNSGVRIHYEVHGTGQPTILLLPTWAIVDSRHWKMQVPFLARDYRVITFDPRGNGRSDRPRSPAAYGDAVFASDAAAVLDATGTEQAVLAAFCSGFGWALLFAAAHPKRVTGIVAGVSLLELTCDAFARLRKQVPDARMLLVTGPRIDPRLLPDIEGMDKRGYVPDLFEHLACADAAIVQGGLSTTMELVATGRPFIYFPLRRHWEQQHFVTHRLSHYRAGLRMDYTTTTADDLATTMRAALAEAGIRPGYRKIPRGGAGRAAGRIAGLLAG